MTITQKLKIYKPKEGFCLNKDLYFEYIEDFADHIVNKVELDEELFISIVGKFEEIKEIIKEMLVVAEVDFEKLNIESPIIDGYEDEYILDCWCDDGVVQIGCEPLIRDGEYLNLASDEIYLLENCSSKIIPLCDESDLYFVNFNEECDCEEECDDCCCCDCYHDCMEITRPEKYSYEINGKPVSKDEFDKKFGELHEKYEKNMKSVLNDYCAWMVDFNDMVKRLW